MFLQKLGVRHSRLLNSLRTGTGISFQWKPPAVRIILGISHVLRHLDCLLRCMGKKNNNTLHIPQIFKWYISTHIHKVPFTSLDQIPENNSKNHRIFLTPNTPGDPGLIRCWLHFGTWNPWNPWRKDATFRTQIYGFLCWEVVDQLVVFHQPIGKIWSSNWIISPNRDENS